MKKLLIAGLALSTMAGAALPAAAADRRDGRDRYEQRQDRREDRREYRQDRREDRREFRQEAREDRREFRQDQRRWQQAQRRYRAGAYYAPRGYTVRSWSYGQQMPNAYYGDRYVIRDYDSYGLYAPPRGYQWARSGNDAVLVAVAGGVIGAVIAGLFF